MQVIPVLSDLPDADPRAAAITYATLDPADLLGAHRDREGLGLLELDPSLDAVLGEEIAISNSSPCAAGLDAGPHDLGKVLAKDASQAAVYFHAVLHRLSAASLWVMRFRGFAGFSMVS